jgi:hypothetical protein
MGKLTISMAILSSVLVFFITIHCGKSNQIQVLLVEILYIAIENSPFGSIWFDDVPIQSKKQNHDVQHQASTDSGLVQQTLAAWILGFRVPRVPGWGWPWASNRRSQWEIILIEGGVNGKIMETSYDPIGDFPLPCLITIEKRPKGKLGNYAMAI